MCVSFSLCNALATFQHLMQNMVGELNLIYCIIYLDDMIMFGCTEEEHLECFCMFNLKLKLSKCSFFQSEIVYLAHHISHDGNVHAVEEFPMAETYTQVHAFCRLAGHYRNFIMGFAHIVCLSMMCWGKDQHCPCVCLP